MALSWDQDRCGQLEPERFNASPEILKRPDLVQFAGGDHRKDRLHKPLAYGGLNAETDLSVGYQFPKLPFRLIVRRFNAFHLSELPQGIPVAQQKPGKSRQFSFSKLCPLFQSFAELELELDPAKAVFNER